MRKLHNVLDNPRRWTTEVRPPFFDRRSFQKRIDDRVGKNRDGKSIVLLRWAPEVETWALGERAPRYWIRRFKDGEKWHYVCVPRWVLELRLEKEVYYEAHSRSRFQRHPDTDELLDIGEPPEDYYKPFDLLADHDEFRFESGYPQCCELAYRDEKRRCWGYYRAPNDSDLTRLDQSVQAQAEEKVNDAYRALSVEELAAVEFEAGLEVKRIQDEHSARLKENSDDFNKTMARVLTTTTFDQGRWKQQGPLIVPN